MVHLPDPAGVPSEAITTAEHNKSHNNPHFVQPGPGGERIPDGAGPTGNAVTSDIDPAGQGQGVPPSRVADVDYPNVPMTTEPQQAATDPSAGGTVKDKQDTIPFKEQVNGYAKKFAGTVFGNKEEKEFGEAKLDGKA